MWVTKRDVLASAPVQPELSWRHVGGAAERACETCLRRESRSKGDFAQGELANAYHLLCGGKTSLADIALRRHPHRRGEDTREVKFAQVGHLREVADGEILLKVLVDIIQDTSRPDVVEASGTAGDAIDQVSVDVTLDQACREHEGGHLRDHAARRGLLR